MEPPPPSRLRRWALTAAVHLTGIAVTLVALSQTALLLVFSSPLALFDPFEDCALNVLELPEKQVVAGSHHGVTTCDVVDPVTGAVLAVVVEVDGGGGQPELALDLLEGPGEGEHGGIAASGVLLQGDREDPHERGRDAGASQGRDRVLDDAPGQLVDALGRPRGLEGAVAGEHRVDGRGQGVDVGGGLGVARPDELLRRGPGHAHAAQLVGGVPRPAHGRDPEVGQDRTAVDGEQDVRGLDIAVDDARAVRGLDGPGDADGRVQGLGDGHDLLPQPHAQLRGRAVLHDDEGAPVGGHSRSEDGQDRRVRGDLRHEVGLGLEAGRRAAGDVGVHDLDRDLAPRHVLLVEVDARVAARPELAPVGVPGDLGVGGVGGTRHGRSSSTSDWPSPRSRTSPLRRTMGSV